MRLDQIRLDLFVQMDQIRLGYTDRLDRLTNIWIDKSRMVKPQKTKLQKPQKPQSQVGKHEDN